MKTWKIVPLHKDQLRDIAEGDSIYDGHFRLCNTYKGGGGYDRFPHYAVESGLASHSDEVNRQFIVQLYGCNLDCPYCYVTRAGVWSKPIIYTTQELINVYLKYAILYKIRVFHLMGGAPGIYMSQWYELIDMLPYTSIFHSDLMLTEKKYMPKVLNSIAKKNVLLAINIKGLSNVEYFTNTRKIWDKNLFYRNLHMILSHLNPNQYYFTFTNVDSVRVEDFINEMNINRYYSIDLIDYKAMPYVDNMPWGGVRDSRRN